MVHQARPRHAVNPSRRAQRVRGRSRAQTDPPQCPVVRRPVRPSELTVQPHDPSLRHHRRLHRPDSSQRKSSLVLLELSLQIQAGDSGGELDPHGACFGCCGRATLRT